MSWRTKMKEQRTLKGQNSKLLFKRVALLIEIEADEKFQTFCTQNDVEPLNELDAEVAEINASYLTLKTVMDHYPHESDWAHNLSTLIAEIKQKQKRQYPERQRVSWKEQATKLAKENAKLNTEIQRLQTVIAKQEERLTEIDRLRAVIAKQDDRIDRLMGLSQSMAQHEQPKQLATAG